jgi:hypothetical protein
MNARTRLFGNRDGRTQICFLPLRLGETPEILSVSRYPIGRHYSDDASVGLAVDYALNLILVSRANPFGDSLRRVSLRKLAPDGRDLQGSVYESRPPLAVPMINRSVQSNQRSIVGSSAMLCSEGPSPLFHEH